MADLSRRSFIGGTLLVAAAQPALAADPAALPAPLDPPAPEPAPGVAPAAGADACAQAERDENDDSAKSTT